MTELTRRETLAAAAAVPLIAAAPPPETTAPPGRPVQVPAPRAFTADWASLTAGYSAPDWFRDAKFGMWAHWTAQCVPAAGDWYAREMYLPGSRAYAHHLKTYGHPADTGFMEMQNRWKADKWEPARLLDLYKKAGARYFMALANHHDNFDCYASTHHPWNSTRVGPRQDIVGTWGRLARERGLRFGVSNHSSHAWHWNQPAYGYDPEGPRRGERYDAHRLTKADGRGTWWDGLDPRDLYTQPSMVLPDGLSQKEAKAWHERNDRLWDEGVPKDASFTRNWELRCRELVDRYRPDLLYFDNADLPLQQVGLDIAAHFYNQSMRWNGGRLEAVLAVKGTPVQRRMGVVDDVERGGKPYIETFPWQTDTCIGNWHYDQDVYDKDGYKSAATVIHSLCDIVSKNGNLMLNVPLRGDGSIDDKEERIVEGIATWMGRYGEAIYATRPWRVHAEGPNESGGSGHFSEGGPVSRYKATDIRYAMRDGNVHAYVLGWPEGAIARLTLLGRDNPVGRGEIERVTLPGSSAPLRFTRRADALEVMLPDAARNDIGVALIVHGTGLTA